MGIKSGLHVSGEGRGGERGGKGRGGERGEGQRGIRPRLQPSCNYCQLCIISHLR